MFCHLNPRCCGKASHLWRSKLLLKNHQDRKQVLVLKKQKTVKSPSFGEILNSLGESGLNQLNPRLEFPGEIRPRLRCPLRCVRCEGGELMLVHQPGARNGILSLISLVKPWFHGDFMGFHGGFWGNSHGFPHGFKRSSVPRPLPYNCGFGPRTQIGEANGDDVGWLRWLVQENSKNPAIDMYVLVLYIYT